MIEELSLALPLQETTGSHVDLAALVEAYSTLLFRVAHSVLRNPAEAEDVVQDTFVRVLEHQRSLPAVRDLRVWLVRIAGIWHSTADAAFAPTKWTSSSPQRWSAAIYPQTRRSTNSNAYNGLPKAERQVLLLSAIEELDTTEVAQIMGKSDSAVRALLFRARTRLRDRLSKGGKS